MSFHYLPMKRVTRIGFSSLDILANVFNVLFVAKFRVCEHNVLCDLEINSNGSIKREHVKSCPTTTKSILPPHVHVVL